MSNTPKILAFAGSAREDSFNKKLIRIAADGARDAGADVTLIDLRDYPLPIMDQDLEAEVGVPENARRLKDLFAEHQGLLIAAPEYNSSITPLLKNTIDWVSRPEPPDVPMLQFIAGKHAALMSASPGALGGMRGLVVVRMLLGNIQVSVLPDQVSVSGAGEAFDDQGNLVNADQQQAVRTLGAKLADTLKKLGN